MDIEIEEIERDIIREILNISLAKAADSFALIAKDTVLINVPDLQIITRERAVSEITERESVKVIIHSEIKGDLTGNTLMFFASRQIENLKQACLRDHFDRITEKELESLLLEISNIITGTLVTQLANILKLNIYGSVPHDPIYTAEMLEDDMRLNLLATRSFLITVNTLFINHKNEVGLPLMLIFDLPDIEKILTIIRKNNYKNFLTYNPAAKTK